MGNGHSRVPQEFLGVHFPPLAEMPAAYAPARKRRLWPAVLLFFLTVLSTLAVGAEFAASFAENREPFSTTQNPWTVMSIPLQHPRLLVLGIPFSFTLLAILFAHEMGHYIACKLYGIDVSYPYFIPAPTLIGTFGAFIRIRSRITTRRALFDVGLAGPVAGFVVALPAVIYGIATAKVVPHVDAAAAILFGHPPLFRIFLALFHPHINPDWVLLPPVARAAWVGLFATALNLLPAWQLDGGHIVYTLAERYHRTISFVVAIALLALGWFSSVWYLWGALLLILNWRFRHPPLADPWQTLGSSRRVWAAIALLIFLLCFTPWAVTGN
jgi:membrane-associated protease RseP (regulator of RpoE activity)